MFVEPNVAPELRTRPAAHHTSREKEHMISIRNLTRYYGSFRALDDVSIDIDRGQIVGLLGPNGAGKTTTMRILTGYLTPTSGTIEVEGLDVVEDSIEVKRRIGYLPESAPIYPDMLTYDYLDYIASIRSIPRSDRAGRIVELSQICGLDDVMHKSVKELSRGYKQRVGLAYAMMSDPQILVLDEPTAGLDPNQIVQIRSIIRKMGERKTVIFSTHILSEAEATCDRIVIINRGRIVADGTPQTLGSTGLQSQLVRVTLRDATDAEVIAAFSGISGVARTTVDPSADGSYIVVCNKDLRAEIYAEIKRHDWVLLEFSRERQSLEDTFRELTAEAPQSTVTAEHESEEART
jgi:ABC-2 type transport system ATP-binding protein